MQEDVARQVRIQRLYQQQTTIKPPLSAGNNQPIVCSVHTTPGIISSNTTITTFEVRLACQLVHLGHEVPCQPCIFLTHLTAPRRKRELQVRPPRSAGPADRCAVAPRPQQRCCGGLLRQPRCLGVAAVRLLRSWKASILESISTCTQQLGYRDSSANGVLQLEKHLVVTSAEAQNETQQSSPSEAPPARGHPQGPAALCR